MECMMDKFICHICDKNFQLPQEITSQGDQIKCTFCQSEFVEKIDEEESMQVPIVNAA